MWGAAARGFGFSPHRYNRAMSEERVASLNFEKSLEELERIVKELEKGDLPLERSLELFESGMRLSSECKRLLEEAESRVEVLTKRGSEVVALPFNPDKPA
jgi:exodeoxyribonuclease VII small subunit